MYVHESPPPPHRKTVVSSCADNPEKALTKPEIVSFRRWTRSWQFQKPLTRENRYRKTDRMGKEEENITQMCNGADLLQEVVAASPVGLPTPESWIDTHTKYTAD